MITNNLFSIIDSELSCADAQSDEGLLEYVYSGVVKNSMVCDQDKDRAYFLVAAPNPKDWCEISYPPQRPGRTCKVFGGPPGASELGSDKRWGRVSAEDIVFG